MVGVNVRRLRKEKGLSRAKLASELGLTGHGVEYIENGKVKNPRLNTLKKLADFFNISIDELIK